MKISLNWLRDFVDLPKNLDPQDLADKLTMHVVEVEGFERQAEHFEKMVVGKVLNIGKHPNADRLSVCTVDIGIGEREKGKKKIGKVQIVCGGKNLHEGMLVAVALPGSRVKWHGEGDLVELKEAEIRGVTSFGMICAGSEIGLDELQKLQPIVGDGPQILDVSAVKAKPGIGLAKALGKDDVIFEISNVSLSNRPDLWSHFGIAIEVGRLYGRAIKTNQLKMDFPIKIWKKTSKELTITIKAKNLCLRYVGALIDNVSLKETPLWMQQRLLAVGQRLISPLVDISNYVMFEIGQPVHIFDKSKVESRKSKVVEMIVRKAKKGEKLTTLDGIERELDGEMLVIADHQKPIAIAGVMGGLDSGVTGETTSIIVECATFDPVSVRKTSARLGLKTDASQRFEKSLDPQQPGYAVARILALINECSKDSKASIVRTIVDAHGPLRDPKPITVPYSLIERRIGSAVSESQSKRILQGLGFRVKGSKKEWKVTPPSKRTTRDISIPEDIIEEVARHLGYNTIPDSLPSFPIIPPAQSSVQRLERAMKRALVGMGFFEVIHKPFLNPTRWERFGLETGEHLTVVNPIDPDARFLRQSLLPGLCEDIKANRNERETVMLIEWGKVFIPIKGDFYVKTGVKEKLPCQPLQLTGVIYAQENAESVLRKVKGIIHGLLTTVGLRAEIDRIEPSYSYYNAGSALIIKVNGSNVGDAGLVSEALKRELAASSRHNIALFTIDIEALAQKTQQEIKFSSLPHYPSVWRDVSLVVGESVRYADIETAIRAAGGTLLQNIELFDIFRGGVVPEGRKSLALHLTFRSSDKTLKNEEVEVVMKEVINAVIRDLDASVRE